jgi:hypothetical protein
MASNKNQHFVPRCYLKPFTLGGAGLAINLFNTDIERPIQHAPVKGQCSGTFFYGEDLILERSLQAFEGLYGAALTQILHSNYRLNDDHRHLLRHFWCLQYLRTEAASRRAVEMSTAFEAVAGLPANSFRLSIRETVQSAMRNFNEVRHVVDDMKVCLFRNRSPLPLVTSDDPAIMTNRLHLQKRDTFSGAPGLSSAGAIFLLPLSPEVLFVAYDGGVYTIPNDGGWVYLDRERDVNAFNQHQYLNCRANVYFHNWDHRHQIAEHFGQIAARRLEVHHRIHYTVFDHAEDGGEVFRVIDREAAGPHESAIIHTEGILAAPIDWPAQIAYRGDAAFYSNNSGTGYVRLGALNHLGGEGYRKNRVRASPRRI